MESPPAPPTDPRLAGPNLRDRAGVRYSDLPVRRLLNRCDSKRMPDCWTINPYRGCVFGCRYCYARYTHEFLGFDDPADFERHIFVKLGAPQALEAESSQARLRRRPIAIGTATDPYQPAEAQYLLTRQILEILSRYRGLEISIITKSALITRDIDLLQKIAARSTLQVFVSLITVDKELARILDPGAPTPERRVQTLSTLVKAGIPAGVNALPILPGINDGEASLRKLFAAAARANAGWISVGPLFLASASRKSFLRWLKGAMPEQLPRYRRLFAKGMDVDPRWRERLDARVGRIRAQFGLPSGPLRPLDRDSAEQLALPGVVGAEMRQAS